VEQTALRIGQTVKLLLYSRIVKQAAAGTYKNLEWKTVVLKCLVYNFVIFLPLTFTVFLIYDTNDPLYVSCFLQEISPETQKSSCVFWNFTRYYLLTYLLIHHMITRQQQNKLIICCCHLHANKWWKECQKSEDMNRFCEMWQLWFLPRDAI